jgi:hypothetical protein
LSLSGVCDWILRLLMVFNFPVVGLAQTDHKNLVISWCEDHGMKPPMYQVLGSSPG